MKIQKGSRNARNTMVYKDLRSYSIALWYDRILFDMGIEIEWINVNDKLPEKDEWVLVFNKVDGVIMASLFVGKKYTDQMGLREFKWWKTMFSNCCDRDMRDFEEFTHWMPLPQPPKDL